MVESSSKVDSAKSLSNKKDDVIFAGMEPKYTNPEIKRGKAVTDIPKESTKKKEQAKQTWYISFQTFDPVSKTMKRSRIKGDINRIKDPSEKEEAAQLLCETYRELLRPGALR